MLCINEYAIGRKIFQGDNYSLASVDDEITTWIELVFANRHKFFGVQSREQTDLGLEHDRKISNVDHLRLTFSLPDDRDHFHMEWR